MDIQKLSFNLTFLNFKIEGPMCPRAVFKQWSFAIKNPLFFFFVLVIHYHFKKSILTSAHLSKLFFYSALECASVFQKMYTPQTLKKLMNTKRNGIKRCLDSRFFLNSGINAHGGKSYKCVVLVVKFHFQTKRPLFVLCSIGRDSIILTFSAFQSSDLAIFINIG